MAATRNRLVFLLVLLALFLARFLARTSASGRYLQAGFAPRAVDAKCFHEAALALGDEDGFSVGAAEGEIDRLFPQQGDFAFDPGESTATVPLEIRVT